MEVDRRETREESFNLGLGCRDLCGKCSTLSFYALFGSSVNPHMPKFSVVRVFLLCC